MKTTMKTYTLLLDFIILSLLVLAIHFSLSDSEITHSVMSRRGSIRTTVICWQSLMFVASFCVLLRYIARNVAV